MAMRMIQIVKLPDGEAPEEIRKAWIGLKLPCIGVAENGRRESIGFIFGQQDADCIQIVAGVLQFGVQEAGTVTGKKLPNRNKLFIVNQFQALQVLEQNNTEATQWWLRHGFPRAKNAEFLFGGDEAIEIQPRDD
jgi:hypothetical protein